MRPPRGMLVGLLIAVTGASAIAQQAPTDAALAVAGDGAALDRSLDAEHADAATRGALHAIAALHALVAPPTSISPADLLAAIARAAPPAERALPAMTDAAPLLRLANDLAGVLNQQANPLDYWGPDAALQAGLQPLATLVDATFGRAGSAAMATAAAIADQLAKTPDDSALADRWQAADNLATAARYGRATATYDELLAVDRADPQRAARARAAAATLRAFDSAETGVQPAVRVQIGKLLALAGDTAAALGEFDSVRAVPTHLAPPPTPIDRFQASCRAAEAQLWAGQLIDAAERLKLAGSDDLPTLPQPVQHGATTAVDVLAARIAEAQAGVAKDDASRRASLAEADASLLALIDAEPAYRSFVFQRVAARLPADAEAATLDPLELRAVAHWGEEILRRPGDTAATPTLRQAAAAARRLAEMPATDPPTRRACQTLEPMLLDRAGAAGDAANRWLDLADRGPPDDADTRAALHHAGASLDAAQRAGGSGESAAIDRFLTLAVEKFGEGRYAYDLGRRAEQAGNHARAAAAFRRVSPLSKSWVPAQFWRAFVAAERSATKPNPLSATMQ